MTIKKEKKRCIKASKIPELNMKCPVAQGQTPHVVIFHSIVLLHTAVQFPHYCQLAHMLSWLLHHRKQIFIFFLRLLVPATNTDYAANSPSNGNTELKTSEQHVSANDGFCQSQAGAPCRHKETCWEIELGSNKGNWKYS